MAGLSPELQRILQEHRDALLEEKGKILEDWDPAQPSGGLTGEALDAIDKIDDALDAIDRAEEELQDDSKRIRVEGGEGDDEAVVVASTSGSSGDGTDDSPEGQGHEGGDGPEGPGGGEALADTDDDVVGSARRLRATATTNRRIDLHTAVMARLGNVIDDGDALMKFSGALREGLDIPVRDDIVGGRQPHVPRSPGDFTGGTMGDPRTGGAVDPGDDSDPRHHRP